MRSSHRLRLSKILLLAAIACLPISSGLTLEMGSPAPGDVVSHTIHGSDSGAAPAAADRPGYPAFALGARPIRTLGPDGSCDDCVMYVQQGTTIEQACFSAVDVACTSYSGFDSMYVEVDVSAAPYSIGFELNGLTNTGDWFQSTVLYDWCGTGFWIANEVFDSTGGSAGPTCYDSLQIQGGDEIQLGLYVAAAGYYAGDVCFTAADFTHPQPTFQSCVAQPDPGSSPTGNFFEFGSNSNGFFTGPMTEIIDDTDTCQSFPSIPEATYQFAAGAYIVEFAPWSDEWNPGEGTSCFSTTATTGWTMHADDPAIQVVESSADSPYGPYWEGMQNTSSFSSASWWNFSTSFSLPAPVPSHPSLDVGEDAQVTFVEPIEMEHVDSNPTYIEWRTNSTTAISGCTTNSTLEMLTCSTTGATGSTAVEVVAGETGGYSLTSSLEFRVYARPTLGTPAASRPSADVGQAVSFSVQLDGGSGGFDFAWYGLPPGCVSAGYLAICDNLTGPGSYVVSAAVRDSNGYNASSSAIPYTVFSDPEVSAPTSDRGSVDVGQNVSFQTQAAGGTGAFTYAWNGLPSGCGGNGSIVTCRPLAPFSGTLISVSATDTNGFTVESSPASFVVYRLPVLSISVSSSPALVGVPWSAQATITGGAGEGALNWSGLPPGCPEAEPNVVMLCTPTMAGTYNITVRYVDTNGGAAREWISISVDRSLFGVSVDEAYTVIGVVAALGVGIAAAAIVLSRRRRRRLNEQKLL